MIRSDVAYGPLPKQRYDVCEPDASTGSAVVLVHVDPWWQGEKSKEA